MFASTVVIGTWAAAMLWDLSRSEWAQAFAFGNGDLAGYLDGTRRFLATGSPYDPGAAIAGHTFIHPPSALVLFAPFLVLPAILWWTIPILGTASLVIASRPAPWTWPLVALALAWPRSQGAILAGNSDLWAMFFVALGVRFGWPYALLIVKPTFAPLGLLGIRDRRVWVAAALIAVTMLPFVWLWVEWVGVVRQIGGGITYSLLNLPLILLPLATRWRAGV